ncbi:MAG: 2-amino-4-hydroxy-6-hydroxymethyldihydropteridine diphosphokinase [Cytophagales bacterium]|jgi:dihydroneopterin aldolase/2-amino-4-hydroxy-6-hydroxymethyldihydropteridine diphosphokinase|nr:2-amino-4-hydroxy-6-hydroxymethyldihydropteridine diphosphokinase [Cytophagales bacterium]
MLEKKCITIENLIILACHGYNPEEKKNPQPLSFSLKIFYDYEKACNDNNLESTISFTYVAKLVNDFCKTNTFNLLEKLAAETCRMLMDTFANIQEIQIDLKKINPPTLLYLSSLGVSFTLKREEVYLALGSSMGNRKELLDFAVENLKLTRGVKVLKVSKFIETEPYGDVAKNTFLNGAVKILTYLEPEELLDQTSKIELMGGRTRGAIWGEDRTLDIDIIFFGNKKIATDRLIVPHYDWKNRDFVKIPLKDIAPNLFDF